VTGEEDDRNLDSALRQLALQFEPGDAARHLDIEDEAGGPLHAGAVQELTR
jgi:hypothetical protein